MPRPLWIWPTAGPLFRRWGGDRADVRALSTCAIPDRGTVTSRIILGSAVEFTEFVEINADFDHDILPGLAGRVGLPVGEGFRLVCSLRSSPIEIYRVTYGLEGSFRFGSAKHLGENPAGTWTLRISDRVSAGRFRHPEVVEPHRLRAPVHPRSTGHRRSDSGARRTHRCLEGADQYWRIRRHRLRCALHQDHDDETNDDNWTVVDNGLDFSAGGALQYTIPTRITGR